MEFGVHTLQIRQCYFLLQDHLVEGGNEVGIEESTMEDTQTKTSADELEVVQMLGIDAGSWVDLQGVVVVCGILEQTIEGVEHFMRQQEEEFTADRVSMNVS